MLVSGQLQVFNAIADAIEWIASQEGIHDIAHYLDDYAVIGPLESVECQRALDTLARVCRYT